MTDYSLQLTETRGSVRHEESIADAAVQGLGCGLPSAIRNLSSAPVACSVAGVVGVAGEYCAGAVELFGEDEAGEGVGEGEGAEGEQDFGAR